MFVLKAIRHAVNDLLATPVIEIAVAGVPTEVTLKKSPPAGGWVNDTDLPAVFSYMRSETIEAFTFKADDRKLRLDLVLQAKGTGDDVLDQIDDLQLEIEKRIAASGNLGGLVRSIRPLSSEVHTDRGEVIFAARRVTFEINVSVPRQAPVLS